MCGRSGACAASMGPGRSADVNRRLVACIMPCDTARLGSHERQGRSRRFCGTTSYRVRETVVEQLRVRNRSGKWAVTVSHLVLWEEPTKAPDTTA
jgi:hypothetical protein